VITEVIKRTGCYKSDTQSPKHSHGLDAYRRAEMVFRKELSVLAEIKRDEIKTQNMKRIRLLRKYNTEEKENLEQVIEEFK
jgi:hypothetical protein